jgi:hypothetical protein
MKPRLVWLAAAYLALADASGCTGAGPGTNRFGHGDPRRASIGIQGTRIATHTNASVFNLAAFPIPISR